MPAGLQSMKVVIVDDSALLRQRLAAMISRLSGVEIAGEAKSVAQALELIRRCHPEAVMLDIRLKDGNGFDVLRQVKREPGAPVVIMLTSFPSTKARQTCQALGGDFFFDKTTEFERAIEVLTELEFARRTSKSSEFNKPAGAGC
jgi:DNA-binding NarL/FixJ family response regulator